MPVWEAARCTSAASPYFKPFEWRGKWLFDGGPNHNSLAARAFSEAECIWPSQRCDILLSLGPGTPSKHSASGSRKSFAGDEAVVASSNTTNAQAAWAKFLADHPQQSHNLFRLNPSYSKAFTVKKHKYSEIQSQTETWIGERDEEMNNVCDRLIAALFFFCPSSEVHDGVQVGKIFCRLPPKEGLQLINRILAKADLPLFAVLE